MITQGLWSVSSGSQNACLHLDAHLGRDVSQTAGAIKQQIEGDNLEDARAVAPVAHVHILDVRQFGDQGSLQAGFFLHLAERGLLRLLAGIDCALGQRQNGRWGGLATGFGSAGIFFGRFT